MANIKTIEFEAEVRQIRGMVDGSVNITLNLPEHMMDQAKVLLGWHHRAVRGMLTVQDIENKDNGSDP